jgi:hypothetical protein
VLLVIFSRSCDRFRRIGWLGYELGDAVMRYTQNYKDRGHNAVIS